MIELRLHCRMPICLKHVEIGNKCSMAMSGDIKCKDNPVDGTYDH